METEEKKKGKMGMEGDKANENPSLPHEIIVEILSRLPVKSLCKFRCVSKPWFSLISDPNFVDTHLRKTLNNDDLYSRRQKLLVTSRERGSLYSVNYESIHEDSDDIVARQLDYPNRKQDDSTTTTTMVDSDLWMPEFSTDPVFLLGSSNGLVCIEVDREYYLFNPAIRECMKIPEMPYGGEDLEFDESFVSSAGHGFGYDHVNDDYKLVSVCDCITQLYSLRGREWRRVEDFHGDFQQKTGVLLNGAIHWVVNYDWSELQVAAFDLVTETFWEWDLPAAARDSLESLHGTLFNVGAIEGSLCLLLYSGLEMQNHFWVMNDHNKKKSWTKFTVSFWYMCMRPVCLSVSGVSLWVVDGKLVLYDVNDDSAVELDINVKSFPRKFICEAESYVESLISPHAFCSNREDEVLT